MVPTPFSGSNRSRLLPLVYDELRKLAARRMAQEQPGQTLQLSALVHEAYLAATGTGQAAPSAGSRFYRTAAR
jgi:hypothetical protein